jgi:serine phosphatase RsbU (regulator of sigma subunit)
VLPEIGYRAQRLAVEPGDRIVLVTDGMLERNASRVDLPAVIAGTRDLHPREAVHALATAVLDASNGKLRDDATVLCLDWYGGDPSRDRQTTAGASPGRAST